MPFDFTLSRTSFEDWKGACPGATGKLRESTGDWRSERRFQLQNVDKAQADMIYCLKSSAKARPIFLPNFKGDYHRDKGWVI